MWKCSCGQTFAQWDDRPHQLHTGHSMGEWAGSPSRDVPTVLPEPAEEKFDLTDVDLPPDTVTVTADPCTVMSPDLDMDNEITEPGAFARAVAAEHKAIAAADEVRAKRHAEQPFFCWEDAPPDQVNSPLHYNANGGIECIDAIRDCLGLEGFAAYCHGNALKYLWRHKHKGKSAEDLAKADYYLARMRGEE